MLKKLSFIISAVLLISSCAQYQVSRDEGSPNDEAKLQLIADEYYEELLAYYPGLASRLNLSKRNNRVGDNSLEAVYRWNSLEDGWLARINNIKLSSIDENSIALYAALKERLEANHGLRVCKDELHSISTYGWHKYISVVMNGQPMTTDLEKADAIERMSNYKKLVDNEIENLNLGLSEGYSASKRLVRKVIEQINSLSKNDGETFYQYAAKSNDEEFKAKWNEAVKKKLIPELNRYNSYLEKSYLGKARESLGVGALPNGKECYMAYVRYHTMLDDPIEEFKRRGAAFEKKINVEYDKYALKLFNTSNKKEIRKILKKPEYNFSSREDIVENVNSLLAKLKVKALKSFYNLPKSDLIVMQKPKASERTSSKASFVLGSLDGTKPSIFYINTYRAQKFQKYKLANIVLHEGIPGHYLQFGLATDAKSHKAQDLIGLSAFTEGWGIYSEISSRSLGLIDNDLDYFGVLASRKYAYPRSRLDIGIHYENWSEDKCYAFLKKYGYSKRISNLMIDRLASRPAQTMSYLYGSLEFIRLKEQTQKRLGSAFDIKKFHNEVLRHGTVPFKTLETLLKEAL